MLARILLIALALGLVVLTAPSPAEPVGQASAVCIEDGITDECHAPHCEAAAAYNAVKGATEPTDEALPDAHCTL